MKNLLIVFLILVLSACKSDMHLPESNNYEKVFSKGPLRYVFISFKEGHLYHNDSLLDDIKHFEEHIFDFIESNDGSNFVQVALQCDKGESFHTVDSVLNIFRKGRFLGVVLMTNYIKDSVGIKIIVPPLETYPDYDVPIKPSPRIIDYTIRHDSIFFNGEYIPPSEILMKLKQKISTDTIFFLIGKTGQTDHLKPEKSDHPFRSKVTTFAGLN